MSGKPYTMREMKAIVEYLTEHRAYGEIRGRKMWTDLAASNVTNRTWQSLKETFLKRILPDIHNPYYKLSLHQISSFRQGYDVEARLNNRLQTRSSSQHSNDGVNEKDTEKEKPSNSNDQGEDKTTGEDSKQAALRASTETLVLENCYETAEEIRKDLQSPTEETEDNKEEYPPKSMRELITYSEPLTPMLQGVIDDFATDEEGDEPKMQIVETEEIDEKNVIEENVTIEISDSEGNGNDIPENSMHIQSTTIDPEHSTAHKNENAIVSTVKEPEATNEKSSTEHSKSETDDKIRKKDVSEVEKVGENNTKNSSVITQNNSANSVDTLLPGNQEAFEGKLKTIQDNRTLSFNNQTTTNTVNDRKRSRSQDPQFTNKKRLLVKEKSISDTERSIANINVKIFNKSEITAKQSAKAPHKQMAEKTSKSSSKINTKICQNTTMQEKDVVEDSQHIPDTIEKKLAEIENPCLESISLYDEQFSNMKYSDSESSHQENEKRDEKNKKIEENKQKKNDATEDKGKSEDVREQKGDDNSKKEDDKCKKGDDKVRKRDKKDDKHIDNIGTEKSQTPDNDDNDLVILKSPSDTVTDNENVSAKRRQERLVKQKRDNALANVFGFSNGGASKGHRRREDYRKRNISHNHTLHYGNVSSVSSEWTSDSGSEYVSSPPRQYGRKGRHYRKYLKPKSAPILSLEEEGGLFVMYGKKIYPVVKDGKIVKNYVTCMQEDDPDQEESYWKLKYVEEKKKTAELTKLLNRVKEKREKSSKVPSVSPITIRNSSSSTSTVQQDVPQQAAPQQTAPQLTAPQLTAPQLAPKTVPAEIPVVNRAEPEPVREQKIVKIKFIKKNEEVQLEGHWSQLNPVLAQVAQLFQTSPDSPEPTNSKLEPQPSEPMLVSGKSTPIEDVIEKVNKREDDIAKEIEKYYKEETKSTETVAQMEENITKRKGRPRKVSPAVVPPSPAKKAKLDVESTAQSITLDTEQKAAGTEKSEKVIEVENNAAVATRRMTRTPRKLLTDAAEVNEINILRTRRSTPRRSHEKVVDNQKEANTGPISQESDDIRYKFPSPPANRRSYTNKNKTKNVNQRKTKSGTNTKTQSTSENITYIENEQRDQDSVNSPSRYSKKRINVSTLGNKNRYATRFAKKEQSYLTDDITSESSNSFPCDPLHSITFQNSTLSSDIYKSESFRLLTNKDLLSRTRNIFKLTSIKENSTTSKDVDETKESSDEIAAYNTNGNSDSEYIKNLEELFEIDTNNDNSSSVSLPTSPALSIVENISISKTLLNKIHVDDLDKSGDMDFTCQIMLNSLMTQDDDGPVMEQECDIDKSCQNEMEYHYNKNMPRTTPGMSETLLNKINTVNLEESSLSDSLNVKLKNLLLESSKKQLNNKYKVKSEIKDKLDVKNTKTRKRSSTPRKRPSIRKLTPINSETCVIEEHMESCSRSGRQSCPPVIVITEYNETEIVTENETAEQNVKKPTRGRKKKDIIKVRITKPKPKAKSIERNKRDTNSTDTDLRVNNLESRINQDLNDSVDLIHNHSETCLNAHECMGDSVEIVDSSAKSIVTLDSSRSQTDILPRNNLQNISDNLTLELFSNDAQDGTDVQKDLDQLDTATVYHTPEGTQSSPNSLITEDLSNETPEKPAPNTKWYLLSEDDTSNTNFLNKNVTSTGYGANLEQIFPVTCAVPDLSTITEMSRETSDSRKFCDESNTRHDSDTPNKYII